MNEFFTADALIATATKNLNRIFCNITFVADRLAENAVGSIESAAAQIEDCEGLSVRIVLVDCQLIGDDRTDTGD